MKGGRNRALAIAIAAALLFVTAGCSQRTAEKAETGAEKEPYKIGAVLSLTGTYAALGKSEQQAIELEVDRINAAGGINGRPLEVIIEDDATDEAKAVTAAAKLIEQDEVIAILGASGSGQTMAMRGDLQRAGIPQISMAGATVITAQFDPLVFQTPWSNRIVVPFVLDAVKQGGYEKVGLLSDAGGYGKDGRDVILAEAEKTGLKIVSDQTFNPGDTDLSAQLTKIKGSGAEALLIWTAGKEGALAVKNARSLGLDVPMFGGSGQAKLEFISGAGEAAEGFVFGTGRSLEPSNWGEGTEEFAAVNDFASRYEAKYGERPDIFAGHAFDAIAIVSDALKRAGDDPDSASLRDAIEKTQGLAGFGGKFSFSSTDHNGLTTEDLALYKIEGGKWTAAK